MSNQKIVRLLIEKGADLSARNNRGETPLHEAALVRRRENVKVLIESGANINAISNNKSVPLHLACLTGGKGAVEELVEAGADVNARDRYGTSPMYYAQRHTKIVSFLEKNAAEIKNTPEVFNEVAEWFEETIDTWSRKLLPELKGKVLNLDEIKKRNKSLIARDLARCGEKGGNLLRKMSKELS